jgi:transposase
MVTLIQTARLNDVDPQAWLADIFARIPANPAEPHPRVATLELEAADRKTGNRQRRLSRPPS